MSKIFAWHYGPDGQAAIFQDSDDVPEGWRDHPFAGDPVDRGGDDGENGSPALASADLKGLRAEYERRLGKKPFMGWDAATLIARMKDAG